MRVLTILTFICASVTAMAFDDFDFTVANIDVLRDKTVQKELNVTETQRNIMNGFVDKYTKAGQEKINEYQKAKKKPDQAYANYAQKQFVDLRTNVLKTLTPGQVKRLREITLQAVGPRALLDQTVSKKVGMSTDEYYKFRAAIAEGDQKIAKIKGQVAEQIRAKYKTQKPPTSKKESDALNAKINKDLEAEMKKHAVEMATIMSTSDKKTKAIVKPQYLTSLKALMGKPFSTGKAMAPQSTGKMAPNVSGGKAPGKKGG